MRVGEKYFKIICNAVYFFLLICLSISCTYKKNYVKTPAVFLSDRHVASYQIISSFTQQHNSRSPYTLVLLDYHHDIAPQGSEVYTVTSVNWVGKLIEEKRISKVIWVSGRTLLLPNRNARMAWLDRSLKKAYPDTAAYIKSCVTLCDWNDLQQVKINGPFVVTLDFDVFMKDPGPDANAFVDEVCAWTQAQKPQLVTLALSATYQKDASATWEWLVRFVRGYHRKSTWYFQSGLFGESPESNDDIMSWKKWHEHPEQYQQYQNGFYRGAYLWLLAPKAVRDALLAKDIQPTDASKSIITAWKNDSFYTLQTEFSKEVLDSFAKEAVQALCSHWNGTHYTMPGQVCEITNDASRGVAVRFKNNSVDRGCLSLYGGLKDMDSAVPYCAQEAATDPRYDPIVCTEAASLLVNISVFGAWQRIDSPEAFCPGTDSLLLDNPTNGERTLLQASIAIEHAYTKTEFLSRLSHKAGLGFDGWKQKGIVFWKAETLTYTVPFSETNR